MATALGYSFLRDTFRLTAFRPPYPACVKPVTRVERKADGLAVPRSVAPSTDDPLDHLLFALKHEGTNLQILAEALPHLDPGALQSALRRAPTGAYIRIACFLWEQFTGRSLDDLPTIGGPTAPVFDPKRYVTRIGPRAARWRVQFNGLGSLRYCATVERTPAIEAALNSDLLGRTRAFAIALNPTLRERALTWAYLHETESSFAIEHEAVSEDKARAFARLLRQAHDPRPLSEAVLAELQSSVLTNPLDRAVAYRTEQNWLRGPLRGAAAITYLPPPPDLLPDLMAEWVAFVQSAPTAIDPLVAASIASFGFVFLHPFLDGNGRLSRFAFHQALCRSGRLADGWLLPVSVAMKKHESDYLAVLQAYSRPLRERWSVLWIDADQYEMTFQGHPGLYRYWDATECVAFGYRMAEQALETELRQETDFLSRYDRIIQSVGARFDVRGSDLATLVVSCLDQQGRISQNRRKQFAGRVPDGLFAAIELCAREGVREGVADNGTESQSDRNPPLFPR